MKILFFFRYLFICLLFLQFISKSYINVSIDKFFIDFANLLSIILIVSLIIEKRVFSVILLLYALAIIILNFSPVFMSEKIAEKIYYDFFLGLELSSFIRLNITNTYWIVNPIMNLSFYLAGYIILLELPYRLYKAKKYPFNKMKSKIN